MKTRVIRDFLNEQELKVVREHIKHIDCADTYNDSVIKLILESKLPEISELVQKRLTPTYCFLRKYVAGMDLGPHRDRNACEYSGSICIDSNVRWPLIIDSVEYYTNPGDCVIYKGIDNKHWRDALQTGYCNQAFIHYVDLDGPYRFEKGDKRFWKLRAKQRAPI